MKDEPISVSFCISDSYAQHLAVVIASLLVNNPDCDFVFHVVHHSILPDTEAKLRELERMYPRHRIVFHAIDETAFARFPLPATLMHVTREMYYRYLLPEILRDEHRTIYSDVDVLCRDGGIRALWEMDLGGRAMGAVRKLAGNSRPYIDHMVRLGMDASSPSYFSGLLVMDLEKLRGEQFAAACMRTTDEKADELVFPDMDVINVLMEGRMADIDPLWNMTERYSFFRRDVKIWHFVGQTQKPWCRIWKNVTWIPYLKYLLKTPYRSQAVKLVWSHVTGIFWFSYTKNSVRRYLFCGIRVWKRRETAGVRNRLAQGIIHHAEDKS